MNRQRIETQLREILAERTDVSAAYLFGSVARGTSHCRSDVDVGVLFAEDPPRTLIGLALSTELESEIGHRIGEKVQVTPLNHAPVDLIHRVLRDGVLLKEQDRSQRVRFEVKARREYFDLLPVLRRCRRMEPAA